MDYRHQALYVSLLFASSIAAAGNGTAIVRVVVDPPGEPASFSFSGVPSGIATPDKVIRAANLSPGAYTGVETGGTPGYVLANITCDDSDSFGYVETRTSRFLIDNGETVQCTYFYTKNTLQSENSSPSENSYPPDSSSPAGSPSSDDTPDPDEFPNVPPRTITCDGPEMVPKAGTWMVSNLPGTMTCGPMTMPLAPSREPGTLTHIDCGNTIIGSGMSDDTADLTMRAVDKSGQLYKGSVGGSRDGIPMTINFVWEVESETKITGQLHSQVSAQGMSCVMAREFEMEYGGG